MTSKLEHYSLLDKYRELNIVCFCGGLSQGIFCVGAWVGIFYGVLGFAKVYFGWVGVGRNFLWVGKVRWRYILGGWG